MLGDGGDGSKELSPDQRARIDENRRAAEEKLRAKQGNANNNAAPTPKANSMSSQNTMKTPKSGGNANAGSSSNSAGSGLVQKSIMSFFKTPGAPASASASQQQQPAKTPSGPSASSTKPSPGPTRTPASASASTPSGVKPAFFKTPGSASASTSTALQSEDVDLTGDDDDVQVTGSGRPAASTSNRPASDSEEEEIIASSSRRLKRPAIPESSDEEAMSKSAANQKGKKKARQVASSSSESDEDYAVDESMSEAEEPVRKSGKGGGPSSTANKTPRTQSSLDQFRAPPKSTPGSSSKASNNNKPFSTPGLQPPSSAAKGKSSDETRYPWLETVRDAQGRTEEDPDYDQRTLHIPQSAWNKFTAFEKQYWEIKCKHWDTVVFFKKGKFYELYEKDAYIGHRELDLKLTERVNMAMAGVPEGGVDDWAAKLLARGYRVAKVDQLETKVGKRLDDKKNGKKDSIIKRGLSYILTNGTLTDPSLIAGDMSTYCLALKEDTSSQAGDDAPKIAACFVDAAVGEFSFASFTDDGSRTGLETMVLQLRPREIIFEKSNLSAKTLRVLKLHLPNADYQGLLPEREFWAAETTLHEMRGRKYLAVNQPATAADEEESEDQDEEAYDGEAGEEADAEWPQPVRDAANDPLLFSAFGGLVWYLRSLKLERQLLSQRNFSAYDPLRRSGTLVLDSQTLINLDVLQGADGTEKGSLFEVLCRCATPMGKRLLKRWLCHPLRNPEDIEARLDAVDDFCDTEGLLDETESKFRKLPDIERAISRIHAGTSRPKEFVSTLDAFDEVFAFFGELEAGSDEFKSSRLRKLAKESFSTELKAKLDETRESFDLGTSGESSAIDILPRAEFDTHFAACLEKVETIQREMQDYLAEQRRALKSSSINFKDLGNEKYQLEMSVKIKPPSNYIFKSKTKDVHRFYTPQLTRMIEKLEDAEELLQQARQTAKLRLYQKFDESYQEYLKVVRALAEIDCYVSLSRARMAFNAPVCRPEFVDASASPTGSLFEVKDLRHPQFASTIYGQDFIPNDTSLGGTDADGNAAANMIILTGANMAGKSTLLRQIGLCVILAQLGSYIPASSCRLTPCDRIFTRIGANDNIIAGLSTFMVELKETSRILNEATPASLVILDELGRGTSTHDGYAIALSVLHDLVARVGCLGLFTTHHAMLTSEFAASPLVRRCYMSYVSNDDERTVSFLYKVAEGVSPKSYGMNVASMAGVPASIVDVADAVAKDFERQQRDRQGRATQERSALPLMALADFAALFKRGEAVGGSGMLDVALRWANVKGLLATSV